MGFPREASSFKITLMFQQQAESEGVQPNHSNNMPNSISEEPINRLPSNLGGSAHQSQLFYMPNSSSEEPIHPLPSNLRGSSHHQPREQVSSGGGVQPNVNPGGSAHQQQLTEAQIAANYEIEVVQPNVNPSLQPNHESGGVQPDVNPSLIPNHGSGGVQPNVNTSLQPNIDSVPRAGSSEEPQLPQSAVGGGVQPNVNPRVSAHHPQLTGTQIAPNEIGSAEHLKYYRSLHNAAKRGDWESAISFIEKDPNALAARITVDSKTVFHVAALCDQWEFILKLLELVSSPESIAVKDQKGNTVLHYVAEGGSLKTAKALVQKNAVLPQIGNNIGVPPLLNSIWSESTDLVWYLSLMTSVDLSPYSSSWILYTLIKSGYHDIALDFVRRCPPDLALVKDIVYGDSLLYWLATNPSYFFSGSNLGFLEGWIYKFVDHGVEIKYPSTHSVIVNMEDSAEGFPALQPTSLANRVLQWFKRLLWKAIVQLAPSLNMVWDAKLKHESAVELVNHVCTQLSNMSFQEINRFLTDPNSNILDSAIKCGIEEIVRTLLLQFPDLIYVLVSPNRNILQAAIEYRQENIVNVIKEISTTTTKNLGAYNIESNGVTLHLVGKLAPVFKLLSVSGAALQMQRELQWFKEAEEITSTYRREWKNEKNETPEDVFRTEHSKLAVEGEKWMKDTANSCMLVSTLIATVLFAAAFTVPGGNGNDNGIAIFLHTNAFMIFVVSDALGLFSSLTSLLMFLAILTARYELDDFLESLPKKLIIGLGSLFIAIAAMIIAFGASLTIVLSQRWNWVFMPITLVASFPVAIFVKLQLPLFLQMVWSTYGVSIFRPWPSKKFE